MTKRIIEVAELVLFSSVVFIVFLLLFEQRVVVPVWLQPIGRLHPMWVHFPIVLLLLAVALDLLRFRKENLNESVSYTFISGLLLLGALSATLTVIMGLLLSKEEGYNTPNVQWHKWTGTAVGLLAAVVYWARKHAWYDRLWAITMSVSTILLLVGAGHYGASITHGEDFVTAPILSARQAAPVDPQKAVIFTDIIKPIFEQKCTSCHNPDKLKGELALTDAAAISKGGKNGKLYVPGKPDMSLLLQRLHLPLDDKKHMPPTGKTQLTAEELAILGEWVKRNALFDTRVMELPPADTLRMLAIARLKPKQPEEPAYTFAAADDETVKKLNNDYRTIAPLATGSPALAVNLYGKTGYSADKLQELEPIKKQVVYLNLNKLPVRDADLKQVAQFENLQKLDVNFSEISSSGLAALAPLKHLETIAASGTAQKLADLKTVLGSLKNLKTLTLWETGLTEADIQQLQKAYPGITFISGYIGSKTPPIALNPPQLKNPSPVFTQTIPVQIIHPVKGVQIRYTTDGTEPDSLRSPILDDKLVISEATTFTTKAYKPGWTSSPVTVISYYKTTYRPDSATLPLPLNPVHQAAGAKTFFDGRLGTLNANSPAWANNWAGVRKNDLVVLSEFKKPILLKSVGLRTMLEPETGIFPPSVIEVWGGPDKQHLTLLGKTQPTQPASNIPHTLTAIYCNIKPNTVSYLKIVAKPVEKIPDWHNNKGNRALLLVDEILLN